LAAVGSLQLILGIINLTPDSFSGGMGDSSYSDCMSVAKQMISDGATHVDVGAESTRPGAKSISWEEEWARLEPFLTLAKEENFLESLSVDTRKPAVMLRAAALGVSFINCVGQIPDIGVLKELKTANPKLRFIACHMSGEPETMQDNPAHFETALLDVTDYFHKVNCDLVAASFLIDEIYLDPGIGFGKTDAANWGLLRQTQALSNRFNLAMGVSRKGFIGRALNISEPQRRDAPTKLIEYGLAVSGAKIIRTHDVRGLSQVLKTIGWDV
jgi:dihydropteroate synthase